MEKIIILVDIGGTLFFFNESIFFRKISELSNNEVEMMRRFYEISIEFFNKNLWSQKVFFDVYKRAFNLDLSEERFWELFNEVWKGPNKTLIEVLRKLKEKSSVDLYIASNINTIHFQFLRESYPEAFEIFDGYFLSYLIGARKPEKNFFQNVIRAIKLLPKNYSQIYLIDDSSENVFAASNFGILPILYHPSQKEKEIEEILLHE